MPLTRPAKISMLFIAAVVAGALICLAYRVPFGTSTPNVVFHPTPPNLRQYEAEVLTVPTDRREFADIVADSAAYITIGMDEGLSHAMFGRVGDVDVDSSGKVFIVDSEASSVHIFDQRGSYLSSFGSHGIGPGELYEPVSITLVENESRAVVVDMRITIFARRKPGHFEFEPTHSVDYPAFWEGGACSMNGFVYTLDHHPAAAAVIHKYDFEGRHIISFGSAYIADDPFVVGQLSDRGFLACSGLTDVVGWVRSYVPVLHGFSADGAFRWAFRIDGFEAASVVQARTEDGRLSIRFPIMRDGQSRITGLEADDEGRFLWSYTTAQSGPQTTRDGLRSTHHVFQIDPVSRTGSYWGSVPGPVAVWRDKVIFRGDRPFPQVRIYTGR